MLSDRELFNIVGGKTGFGLYAIIGIAITFIAGILDGYFRPLKCN